MVGDFDGGVHAHGFGCVCPVFMCVTKPKFIVSTNSGEWDLALLTVDDDAFWEGIEVCIRVFAYIWMKVGWPVVSRPHSDRGTCTPFSFNGRPYIHSIPPQKKTTSQALPLNGEVTCRPESLVTVAGYYNRSLTTDEW